MMSTSLSEPPLTVAPPASPASASGARAAGSRATATARTAAVVVAVVLVAAALVTMLIRGQLIFLTLFGGIILAEAVRPSIKQLERWIPHGAAIGATFAALAVAVAAVWETTRRTLAAPLATLPARLPSAIDALAAQVRERLAEAGLPFAGSIETALHSGLATGADALLRGGVGVLGGIAAVASAFVMAIFWIDSSRRLRAWLRDLLPQEARQRYDAGCDDMSTKLRDYVGTTLINGFVVAVLCWIGFIAIGMPAAAAVAVVEGILIAIPYVGSFVGTLLAATLALATHGWTSFFAAVAIVAVSTTLDGSFIGPLISQRRLSIDPLLVLLATAIGGAIFGVAGIVLAVPAVAVLQTIAVTLDPARRSPSS